MFYDDKGTVSSHQDNPECFIIIPAGGIKKKAFQTTDVMAWYLLIFIISLNKAIF